MSHAEKCPICGGSGKLPHDGASTAILYPTCHGCGGVGWVTIQDFHMPPAQPIPVPQDPPWKGLFIKEDCFTICSAGK